MECRVWSVDKIQCWVLWLCDQGTLGCESVYSESLNCGVWGCETICMWLGAYKSHKDIRTHRARLGWGDPPLYIVHDFLLQVTKKVHIMQVTEVKN